MRKNDNWNDSVVTSNKNMNKVSFRKFREYVATIICLYLKEILIAWTIQFGVITKKMCKSGVIKSRVAK
jgi:hypothetical protein